MSILKTLTHRCVAVAFLTVSMATAASAAPPRAPRPLNVSVLGVNAMTFNWRDMSTNERGFQVMYSLNPKTGFRVLKYGASPLFPANSTSATVYLVPKPKVRLYFKVRAMGRGASAYTPVRAGRTPPTVIYQAPYNLNASSLSDTTVGLTWVDNSNAEDGFELDMRQGNGPFENLGTLGLNTTGINLTSFVRRGQTCDFRIRAYSSLGYTAYSNTATITGPPLIFNAPTSFTATSTNDGTAALAWTDNSNDEDGFELSLRETPTGTFSVLGTLGANSTSINLTGFLAPLKSYEFQLRAYIVRPTTVDYTPYSNLAPIASPAMNQPTNLLGTTTGERNINLTWTDNSFNEQGYEVLARLQGSPTFTALFYTPSNATSASLNASYLPYPGTTYEFQVRGAFQDGSQVLNSVESNTASATTLFFQPSGFTSTVVNETTANVTWVDHSAQESGFEILAQTGGVGNFIPVGYAAPNTGSATVTTLTPGTFYVMAVRAYHMVSSNDFVDSTLSNTQSVTTKDGISSRSYQSASFGQNYNFQVTTTSALATRTGMTFSTLPAGLVVDTNTGIISGTPTVSGAFAVVVTATYSDGRTVTQTLNLRIVRPPAAPATGVVIPTQTLAVGGTPTIPLADKFTDLDSEAAVRVTTSLGVMDFILYDGATPLTVDNFMGYVDRNDYDGTVIHRSATDGVTSNKFVIQGGAFRPTTAPNNFSVVPTVTSPLNEPGISNLRGTVAMAKQGGNPNSATNQFFVNLHDNNTTILDEQNGGFTVFGRVAGTGMATADAIAALPKGNYQVNLGASSTVLDDFPMNDATAPATIDLSKVVSITSVDSVPVLSFAVTGNSDPGVVGTAVTGTSLQLTGLSAGTSTITVTATDLDNNTVDQTFTVNVN